MTGTKITSTCITTDASTGAVNFTWRWPDGQNPFRKPHYLILNLALGGYGNAVSEKSVFPMEFKVDYVRYFQKRD